MILNTYNPSGILKEFVKNYIVVKTTDAFSHKVIPGPSPILSFRYQGEHDYIANNSSRQSLPAYAITGLRKSAKSIFLSEDTETILVKFKPCAATCFFKEPLHYFSEKSIPLYNICKTQTLLDAKDKILESGNCRQRINIIESFLISILHEQKTDHLIKNAVQKIYLRNGNLKIRDLALDLNISLDVFEKRFRKTVGTSPKQFCSIVRINSIINHKNNDQHLTGIGYDYGYFDQSHFIKDFKQISGQTPFDYFKTHPLKK